MQRRRLIIDNKKTSHKIKKDSTRIRYIKFSKSIKSARDILYNQVIVVANTEKMTYLKRANHNAPNTDQIEPLLICKSTESLKSTGNKHINRIQR